jgi:hypothetical protein
MIEKKLMAKTAILRQEMRAKSACIELYRRIVGTILISLSSSCRKIRIFVVMNRDPKKVEV